MIACIRKSKPIAVALVEMKANVNIGDKTGVTALHIAAAVGATDIVQYLLTQQADVLAETKSKYTCLDMCLESVDDLAKKIAVPNSNNRYNAAGRTQCATQLRAAHDALLRNHKGNWGFSGTTRIDDQQMEQKGTFFGNCDGKDFQVRQLGYSSSKKKGSSERCFFDLHSCEFFTCKNKIMHCSQYMNFPDLPHHSAENMAGLEGIPKFLTQMMMFPDYEPPNPVWGKAQTDGNSNQMFMCFALSEYGIEQLKENKTGPARLLKRFLSADSNGDVDIRRKFKAIMILNNVDALPFTGMLKKMVTEYNGKPYMTGPKCHTFFRGADYLEIDCDWHKFTYMALKSIPTLYQHASKAVWQLGLVVQSDGNAELPEQMLGAVRVGLFDLQGAKSWASHARGFVTNSDAPVEGMEKLNV